MDHDLYIDTLGSLMNARARYRVLGIQDVAQRQPEVPLNRFFGDDLLTLLYLNQNVDPDGLHPIKEAVHVVGDTAQRRHVRAQAAVTLGRFVRSRYDETKRHVSGQSAAYQWFTLARELGSVLGAWEYANTTLKRVNQAVEFDLKRDPLPRLVLSPDKAPQGTRIARAYPETELAWCLGTRTAVRHVQGKFRGWNQEPFQAALACVVNFLVLLPEGTAKERRRHAIRRRASLDWIRPLWNRLIEAASQHEGDTYRNALVEQQLAVFLYLDGMAASEDVPLVMHRAAPAHQVGRDQVVILRGEIPKSGERGEAEYLRQYETLRQPIALNPLPGMETLREIEATLQNEFPWAKDAVDLAMRDLLARRCHGSTRLGFAPLLLVGLPGSGKTRLAQRLGDLLGTPNTVINMAGMSDVKVLKGVTRGWSSNRPSRIVEFILQERVGNPLFILDEVDKAHASYRNGGDPQAALLDLLEPGNARRYQDIYLMAECDLSHCLYVATSNSLDRIAAPLLSRFRPVFFPNPEREHAEVIIRGLLRDLEKSWALPDGALSVSAHQIDSLRGLSLREMRHALLDVLGRDAQARGQLH